MQKMRVQLFGVVVEFMRQDEGLSEPARAIARGIAHHVAEPDEQRPVQARTQCQVGGCAHDPSGFVAQAFGEIGYVRTDFAVDRMGLRVARRAQRIDVNLQAKLFQPVNLLRDEGFRQAGITLENKCDSAGHRIGPKPALDGFDSGPPPLDPAQMIAGEGGHLFQTVQHARQQRL